MDEYLEWYFDVSHCCIIPPRQHIDDVEPSHARPIDAEGPSDDVSLPPHGVDDAHRLQMITVIIDNFMGLVNPDGEIYTLASHAANITYLGIYFDLIMLSADQEIIASNSTDPLVSLR